MAIGKTNAQSNSLEAHASTHASNGNDPITPSSIGAASATHASQHNPGGSDKIKTVLVLSTGDNTISSLPYTFSNSSITANMVVVNSILSNPLAQNGDWEVNTSAGSAVVSGSISGNTAIQLFLAEG